MEAQAVVRQQTERSQPLEVAIQIGLAALLMAGCFLILRPFVPLIMWGIIIAIASYPTFLKFETLLKGRRALASTLWTLLLLLILIVPLVAFANSLVEGLQLISAKFRTGEFVVRPPPASVENWPVIGHSVSRMWTEASLNLTSVLMNFAPEMKAALAKILSASASLGFTVLQFLLSILLSGVLLGNAEPAAKSTRLLFTRLFGNNGVEFQQLIGATIRSVTTGVLGVAFIQSAFAAAGFFLFGLPGASAWCFAFVIAAVIQIGVVVLIPAIVYVFAVASTTKAVLFVLWCVIVGTLDNALKPFLLGRGAAVPMAVVFLGVLGGFAAMGIVGLFVGAVVLSVGYRLFLAWLQHSPADI
jgi:predicted PurR-regulated permease PerM